MTLVYTGNKEKDVNAMPLIPPKNVWDELILILLRCCKEVIHRNGES